VDITVLVCTYNRLADLRDTIVSVATQETEGAFAFELLIADNNSNDGTREMVEEATRQYPGIVRYLFEGRQGKSYALQSGIAQARGSLLFVLDSDQVLPPGYLRQMHRLFEEHPGISILGGKVLPLWSSPPPAWLTEQHWSAVAMCSYGEEPFAMDPQHPLTLLAACFRIDHLRQVGGFRSRLGVSKGMIGSVEDADLIQRMVQAGFQARYDPRLWLHHKAEPDRLTKRYHRRWHRGHGQFTALWRDPLFEQARFTIAGVPSHVFKSALTNAGQWIRRAAMPGNDAFLYETRLHFFFGYVKQRLADTWSGKKVDA
jgi:glycosyltransferase involved in cell wall biosynthesis